MIQHDAGPTGVVPSPEGPPEPTPPAAASATHGSPERRELSFRTSGLSIQLEISGTAESRLLAGQLIPRQSAVVDIRHSAGTITVEADTLGRFSAEPIPPGAVSLRCRLGTPISTGWVTLLTRATQQLVILSSHLARDLSAVRSGFPCHYDAVIRLGGVGGHYLPGIWAPFGRPR